MSGGLCQFLKHQIYIRVRAFIYPILYLFEFHCFPSFTIPLSHHQHFYFIPHILPLDLNFLPFHPSSFHPFLSSFYSFTGILLTLSPPPSYRFIIFFIPLHLTLFTSPLSYLYPFIMPFFTFITLFTKSSK